MKGKMALVMVNDPPAPAGEPQLFAGTALTYYGRWTYKFEEAARQGAAGAILIHTDDRPPIRGRWCSPPGAARSTRCRRGPARRRSRIKAWVTDDAATELVRRGGQGSRRPAAAARQRGFKPVPLGVAWRRRSCRRRRKALAERDRRLKGADERRRWSYTAHYDHFGIRDPSRRQADPTHLQRRDRQRIRRVPGCWRSPRRSRARRRAGAVDLRRVHDRRGVGPARRANTSRQHPVCRRAVAANINIDGSTWRAAPATWCCSAPDARRWAMVDSARRPSAAADRRRPSRTRLLLPVRSLPVRQGRHPGAVVQRADAVCRPERRRYNKKHDAYNEVDYHQPSDEFDPTGISRRRRGHAAAGGVGLADRQLADLPATTTANSLRARAGRESMTYLVTIDDVRAAAARVRGVGGRGAAAPVTVGPSAPWRTVLR